MRTRKLGYTELNLTTVGISTWAIGGAGWEYSWGPQDDDEAIAAIVTGLEQGVNRIGTAEIKQIEQFLDERLEKMGAE